MHRTNTLIAFTATLSGLGVHGSPYQPSDLRRRAMPQIPGYDFAGCYTEATGIRALTGSSYFDDHVTMQKCAAACSGFKYFGVEYGRECYCSNTLNTGSVETDLAECSFSCPGDATQSCGAGNRLSLYIRTPESTRPTPPTSYSYRGCYAEPAQGRALTGLMTGTDDMTVAKCASFCGSAGYSHFGLEYYRESAPEADCQFPCAGDASEKCGGDWRLNVYQLGPAAPVASSSSSSSSTPTPSAGVSTYISEGCYTEASGMRALSDVSFYDDALTVEKCATICSSYTWFGLEYGRECYCGNTINSGSVPTESSDCSFSCAGNSAQKCGAGNRLNMYRYPTTTLSSSSVPFSSTSSTAPGASAASSTISTIQSSTLTPSVDISSVFSSETSTATTSTTPSAAPSSTTMISTVEPSTTTSSSSTEVPTTLTTDTSSSSSTMTSSTSSSSTSSSSSTITSLTSSSSPPSSSSSSSSSTTSTSSTAAPVLPTQAITNGGFENPGGWTPKTSVPGILSYSFANPSDPHSGLQSASVTYSAGASAYQAWFSQPITLQPNKRYIFSGVSPPPPLGVFSMPTLDTRTRCTDFSYSIQWSKASTANPGCSINYYIGTSNGNQNLKTLASITSANLRPAWVQSTGFYDAVTIADLSFNVRWTCTGAAARTYYIDDLSLTTTP
ncbi:WSC domain containing protein [Naviculisporaceae sp. PSN 640]